MANSIEIYLSNMTFSLTNNMTLLFNVKVLVLNLQPLAVTKYNVMLKKEALAMSDHFCRFL